MFSTSIAALPLKLDSKNSASACSSDQLEVALAKCESLDALFSTKLSHWFGRQFRFAILIAVGLSCALPTLAQPPVITQPEQPSLSKPEPKLRQEQGKVAEPVKQTQQDQDQELADEYYRRDDFAKAAELYKNLIKKKDRLVLNYQKYSNCLTQLQQWDDLEKLIKKIIKEQRETYTYPIDLALFYQNHKRPDKATTTLLDLQPRIRTSEEATLAAAEYAMQKGQAVWAKDMFVGTRNYLKQPELFANQMAKVYQAMGDNDQMFAEVLGYLERESQPAYFVQATLQNLITKPEEYVALERLLLNRLSANPMSNNLTEILLWTYLQQKDFASAFVQARALDRRQNQEGQRTMEIAYLAIQNEDYQQAIRIYDYVILTWPGKQVALTAARQQLQVRETIVKATYPIDQDEVRQLIQGYKQLNALNSTPFFNKLENQRSMALLHGFYLGQLDSAIALLQNIVTKNGYSQELLDKSKIDLGDLYVLTNEPWEATLLYSQVEKTQKEQPLGHEAKLRNAKLNYYKGEFQLAQEHLDVLKIATSREIANDALDLSLKIQNNTVMDSASPALQAFSKVELLLFQNKTDQALSQLNQILTKFATDPIVDDVRWLRAKTYRRIKQTDLAIADLDSILKYQPDDIYGDDAQYTLGQIYELDLGDKKKAMVAYEAVLKAYPSSIFAADARKRFRTLRGDVL